MRRLTQHLLAVLTVFVCLAAQRPAAMAATPDLPETCYVFSYFMKNGQDGLHLAWSADGYTWQDIRKESFLKPLLEDKIMRDPCIQRGKDGTFHLVWTTSWTKGGFGYASSRDLIHWTEQRYVPAMKHEPKVANTWAPELTWDPEGEQWMIYWASTIPGRFPATEPSRGEGGSKIKLNHRIYRTCTKDFVTFTPADLFYDGGFSVIDATIVRTGDRYAMVLKDETIEPKPQKNFRLAWADKAAGPYGPAEPPFSTALTKDWIEGPTIIRRGDTWMLYADAYRNHKYVLFTTKDFKTWRDETPKLSLPAGIRHGTVFAVDKQTLARLLEAEPAGNDLAPAKVAANPGVVAEAIKAGERVWTSASRVEPTPNLSSRDLFSYALALMEAGKNTERLEQLFKVATAMQTRDPAKRFHGNFRWSWRDADVFDANAVDFCMQPGALLWLRHRDRLPPAARTLLLPLLEFGAEGLLRHRPNESYTNIALMNACDLILLGEGLGRADLVREGSARLDRVILYTAEAGTHEYVSPTYYGVDLDDLMLIEIFSRDSRIRAQARGLLDFMWSDIALNWFEPAGKLAGARSRDYDYLRGLGSLDQHLFANGWVQDPSGNAVKQIVLAYLQKPVTPASLSHLWQKYPRLVTQIWGLDPWQSRTHFVQRDVTLSSAGFGYGGRMDLPLTIDLPGPRESVRGYFIPDGRHDPYGKVKIQESQAHAKTLHLKPFWTAAQRKGDALGLVLYRKDDIPPETKTLESHFVLPRDLDEIWVGKELVKLDGKKATSHTLPPGAALTVRKGSAAIGIRIPWSRNQAGAPCSVTLVDDRNKFGALLLTVTHHHLGTAVTNEVVPGAAFWLRVGSGISSSTAFEKWRRSFEDASSTVQAVTKQVELRIQGEEGPVAVRASAPFDIPGPVEPAYPRHILAVDGDDLGKRLLENLEPVREFAKQRGETTPIAVPAGKPAQWKAASGVVRPPMTIGTDKQAADGLFVWMPAAPGERAGSAIGRASWTLVLEQAGNYYLWGRVRTSTPENDSFRVSIATDANVVVPQSDWPTGVHKNWTWVRMTLGKTKGPQAFALPAGPVKLNLHVREAGAQIDRLYIAPTEKDSPQ